MSVGEAAFMTAVVWALPSQVVLVGAMASGASIAGVALAVALSAVRLTPMTAAWVPLFRDPERNVAVPRWQLYALSHFVAITAWIVAASELPRRPLEERAPFFAGFAVTLTAANIAVTALSHTLTGQLSVEMSAALFFLTPLYFLTSLSASAKRLNESAALASGLVFGPMLARAEVPLDLLWTGLLGGTLAFLIARPRRAS